MGILGRVILAEIISGAVLGTVLFTFVLFLERAFVNKVLELMVRSSASAPTILYQLSLLFPFALTFTIPVGVLVGVLVALSRMSSDGEITAMRAAGVPSRRVLTPVLLVAFAGLCCTAACSCWLTPFSIRESYRVLNQLLAAQMTAEVQPRVFQEQFSNANKILYVGDVINQSGNVSHWRNIFIADLTPPEQRKTHGGGEPSDTPIITIAREAIAVPDVPRNRIQLRLIDASTHEVGKNPQESKDVTFPRGDQALDAQRPGEMRPTKAYSEMDVGPLWREAGTSTDARIELHQRLALPPGCVLLALVGIPLGVSSRKSGKSAAYVLTVALAFFYYMGLISLIGLARQGTLPVPLAVWTPNLVLFLTGALLLTGLERPGDRDLIGSIRDGLRELTARLSGRLSEVPVPRKSTARNLPFLPQVVDTYILSSFLFYFGLLLSSFVIMTHVYTFFELLSDIIKNSIPMSRVFTYLFFLTPELIYKSTPVSVLVAVLVAFGILAKNNEVTAFKACGVSQYRLSVPVLAASLVVSGSLFAFDHYVVPDANRKQDAIRNEIKGRAPQTWLRPDRKWIFTKGSRIYYYKYYDIFEDTMLGVTVYELDPNTFELRRHISAERARWEPSLKAWVFQNGWTRDIDGVRVKDFRLYQATTFSELDETPDFFVKEVKQDKQMNFRELEAYILDLKQSGFDTVRLQVQYHRKFSVPLFALIMAMISVPFAFLTGNRGAMAGVGLSFGIAIAYWSVNILFEQVGNLNLLPAAMAAWSPDAVFSLTAMYFFARMRT